MWIALSTALVSLSVPSTDPPEWGGFRGNNGVGVARSSSLPASLEKDSATWRVELPAGYSSPVVCGYRVFVTGSVETDLVMMCLDRDSGDLLWEHRLEFDGQRPGANSPAAPTPVTDGERVAFLFHHYGLVVTDLDGEELWREEIGPFNIPHGMATSPLFWDDRLIQLVDQDDDSYLVAYDAATGDELWRTDRPGVTHGYSTPALYEPADGPAQVVVSGSFQIAGYAAKTGEKLWWVDGAAWQAKAVPIVVGDCVYVNSFIVAPSELGIPKVTQPWDEFLAAKDADGDELVSREEWKDGGDMLQQAWFIFDLDGDDSIGRADYEYLERCGHATGALFKIRLDGEGDVTDTHVAWRYDDRRGLPDAPSPIVVGDTLYMIKEGGVFSAIDAETGEMLKQGRVGDPDQYFASPVCARGKIVTTSLSGQLAVVDAQREWEVESVANLDEQVWSTPAIAGDQVFVRSQEALYCFGRSPAD